MSFKIGDRVVCVDDGGCSVSYSVFIKRLNNYRPIKNNIYTVNWMDDDRVGLEELNQECAYDKNMFRKLDDDFGAKVCEQIEKTFIKPLIPVEYD